MASTYTLGPLGIFELKTSAHESVQALSQVLGLDNPKYAQYSQAETMRISGFEGLPIVCSNPFQVCTLTSPSVGLCVPENFGVELSGCMKMLISTETGAKIIQKMSELLQNPSTVALMAFREKPMVSPELKLIFTPAQMEYSPGELTLKINANDVVGQPYLGLIRTGEGFKITSETPADAITHLAGALGHEFLHVIHDLLPTDDVVFGTPKIGNRSDEAEEGYTVRGGGAGIVLCEADLFKDLGLPLRLVHGKESDASSFKVGDTLSEAQVREKFGANFDKAVSSLPTE